MNPSALRRDRTLATRLVTLLRTNADNHRFPWIDSDRSPSAEEFEAGRLASAVAAAIQGAQRTRRGDETEQVEGAVVLLLTRDLGFSQVPAPKTGIDPGGYRTQAPQPGSFMRWATLGGDNGDFVIGLWNSRILALECKSSNSEVNSRKRLNKEAVKNAQNWTATFGRLVLPGVVLRGCVQAFVCGRGATRTYVDFLVASSRGPRRLHFQQPGVSAVCRCADGSTIRGPSVEVSLAANWRIR